MSGLVDANERAQSLPPGPLRDAWAEIAARRSRDPKWDPFKDPTYTHPPPCFLELMTEAEIVRFQAAKEARAQTAMWPAPLPPMPASVLVVFGERLLRLRTALGWTQRMAAEQLGISRRSVIRYEQGVTQRPKVATLLALGKFESVYAKLLNRLPPDTWQFQPGLSMTSRFQSRYL